MITVYIDLPLFSPPGDIFGLATGEVEVPFVPSHAETFPWPDDWANTKPAYFSKEQSAVLGADPWERPGRAKTHVSLCGIVFAAQQEARECALFLGSLGLQFHDLRNEA